MTNPTIVNGVDVSECEYLEKNEYCKKAEWIDTNNIIHKNVCIRQSECLYKKLQRKIQECEKLRESNQAWGLTVSHLREELEEEKKKAMWIKDNKTWYSEAEYKELEERINQQHINIMRNNLQYHDIDTTNKKYKQALEEIRDIAENCRSSLNGYDQEKYPKQIIAKLNEVLK